MAKQTAYCDKCEQLQSFRVIGEMKRSSEEKELLRSQGARFCSLEFTCGHFGWKILPL